MSAPVANAPARYGAVAQSLHWVTAILVVAAFAYGPGGSEQRVYSASRDFDRSLHETLGLCVLAMTIFRLGWRAIDTRPEPPLHPRWARTASRFVQALLYGLLFALPATSICGAWLEGHALTLVGGLGVASPLAEHHEIGALLASIHGWLGDAILWVAGFHAAAAIYHHAVLRDGVLVSMLPDFRRARPRR